VRDVIQTQGGQGHFPTAATMVGRTVRKKYSPSGRRHIKKLETRDGERALLLTWATIYPSSILKEGEMLHDSKAEKRHSIVSEGNSREGEGEMTRNDVGSGSRLPRGRGGERSVKKGRLALF